GKTAGELSAVFTEILEYVIILALPFGLAYVAYFFLHGRNPEPAVRHGAPRMPFLFIFGSIGISYALNMLVNLIFGSAGERFRPEEEAPPETVPGIILYFIMISVLPAILEETAFRGIILKHLLPYGKTGAIVFSSLLFGLLHVSPTQAIFAFAFGIMLGLCYEYTRSIKFTALIHFMNNLISVALDYADRYGNPAVKVLSTLYIYAMMGVGIFALVYYLRNGIKKQRVSFIRPEHIGAKLSFGRSMLHSLLNGGTIVLIAFYAFIIYVKYFGQK
ncbi:MAG: CPBP family intramembrane metalloprotease, partial [Clostridia bacterium]|nr:CPBP family intramembrane metalloprotease [Clostridia bacterium]